MSIFRDFFNLKEKPFSGFGGFGGGGLGLSGGGVALETSGGTVSEHVNKDGKIYKLHLWTTSSPAPEKEFTVGSTLTGDVIVIGGGGAGGNYAGGGGGAGGVLYSASGITINPAPSVPRAKGCAFSAPPFHCMTTTLEGLSDPCPTPNKARMPNFSSSASSNTSTSTQWSFNATNRLANSVVVRMFEGSFVKSRVKCTPSTIASAVSQAVQFSAAFDIITVTAASLSSAFSVL